MIVSPDFLDDWKMQLLSDALARDPAAPAYVLRLWSHCQQKKSWQFEDIPALRLSSICKAPHDSKTFLDAMLEANFVALLGDGFAVPSWAELNAQLIAAWTNGKKSNGRPKKPNGKPSGIPTPPPTEAQRKPDGKPIREEKTGKNPGASDDAPPPLPPAPPPRPEKKPVEPVKPPSAPIPAPSPPPPPAAPPAPAAGPVTKGVDLFGEEDDGPPGRKSRKKPPSLLASADGFPCPDGVTPSVWAEFLAYRLEMSRGNSKAPYTATAMKGVVNLYLKKCIEAGEPGDDALLRTMTMGWRAPFVVKDSFAGARPINGGQRQTQRDLDAARGMQLAGAPPTNQTQGMRNATSSRSAEDIEDVEWRDRGPAAAGF